ncbi:MAG: ROK family protein [Actinomycetes bacterium]|jgi:polyphosphate glucokinase|nr:MAG: polyphosphate glucokinase [Actinomycetota bacterium]
MTTAVGLDIGGTGIKGGVVDLENGVLVGERVYLPTPQPATPESVVATAVEVIDRVGHSGPLGVGFPAVVDPDGCVWTASNIDRSWIGQNVRDLIADATGREVFVANDADAAALCEARFGPARGVSGVVLVITFGTGIGSGVLSDGRLVPNVELGYLELDGHYPCEWHFAARAKTREGLSWEQWVARANRFLAHAKRLFSPQLIVVGGGVTADWDEWAHLLDPGLGVVRASRIDDAGLVGAACLVPVGEAGGPAS